MDEKNAVAEHVEASSHLNLDDLDSIENTESSRYAWLVSITAGVGGLLFGYDTGWSQLVYTLKWLSSNPYPFFCLQVSSLRSWFTWEPTWVRPLMRARRN